MYHGCQVALEGFKNTLWKISDFVQLWYFRQMELATTFSIFSNKKAYTFLRLHCMTSFQIVCHWGSSFTAAFKMGK